MSSFCSRPVRPLSVRCSLRGGEGEPRVSEPMEEQRGIRDRERNEEKEGGSEKESGWRERRSEREGEEMKGARETGGRDRGREGRKEKVGEGE